MTETEWLAHLMMVIASDITDHKQTTKDVVGKAAAKLLEQQERIRRLERAGDNMAAYIASGVDVDEWNEAKGNGKVE